MTKDPERWASISARPTHGTAQLVEFPSVIPANKQDCEVFWVSTLLPAIADIQSLGATVESRADDSHGNDDVVVKPNNGDSIGVQVTELTYELERARRSQSDRFRTDVLQCFRARKLTAPRTLLVKCFLPFTRGRKYQVPRPDDVVDVATTFIGGSAEQEFVEVPPGRLMLRWVDQGELYVPSVGNIGVDCDLDALPRTLDMYCDAVSAICEKKAASKSPWLLISSTTFWRDKHWLGGDVLQYMRAAFEPLPFTRVFFAESLDGSGSFEANLTVHAIKA